MNNEDNSFVNDFEKIKRYYQDEKKYPLSDSLMARLLRWKSAREWILTTKPLTDSFTVQFIVDTHHVSEPQAWRDMRDCKRFFASMEKVNKDFDRIMLIADIRGLRTKAEFAGDLRTVASCYAILQKLGVGEETSEESTSAKTIELHVGFNPKLLGAKEIPNLLAEVSKFIGEEQARRELMIEEENTI